MGHDAKYQQWKREQARQEADKLSQMALAPREEEPEGEPRADVSDALWCMECGYRRGTSSGQTRTKCPHGHGELVRARLLTLEQFSKIVPRPAPAASTEGLRESFKKWLRENVGSGEDGNEAYDDEVNELCAIALRSSPPLCAK